MIDSDGVSIQSDKGEMKAEDVDKESLVVMEDTEAGIDKELEKERDKELIDSDSVVVDFNSDNKNCDILKQTGDFDKQNAEVEKEMDVEGDDDKTVSVKIEDTASSKDDSVDKVETSAKIGSEDGIVSKEDIKCDDEMKEKGALKSETSASSKDEMAVKEIVSEMVGECEEMEGITEGKTEPSEDMVQAMVVDDVKVEEGDQPERKDVVMDKGQS